MRIWIPAFAGMTEGGVYPPRDDGLSSPVIAAPLRRLEPMSQALRPHGSRNRDANMDSRFRGNDGRGGVSASSRWLPSPVIAASLRRLEPSSQALRPHGSRNRDANMDSRFRGNDGRGGVSASSRWPSLARHRSLPPSFPRKRESRAGKDGSLASSQAPRPHGGRNRDTNMDSRFRGNDGGGAPRRRVDGSRRGAQIRYGS